MSEICQLMGIMNNYLWCANKGTERFKIETVYAPVLKSMKLHNTFVIDNFFFTVVNLVLI